MSDTDPFVDWTADVDVNQLGKVTDTQALQKGWSNAKVAGAYIVCFLSVSELIWPIFTAYDDKRCKSEYYHHFNRTITRVPANAKELEHFVYSYICRSGHDGCSHVQKRCQASTDKLKAKAMKCEAAHQGATPRPKQKIAIKYDKYNHRTLVALRCAVSNRPFASVEDEYYKLEVGLLRHGM